MPLEENPYIVAHFEALISCQNFRGGQRFGSTLSLWYALLKIGILLHKTSTMYLFSVVSVFIHFVLEENFWMSKSIFFKRMNYMFLFLFSHKLSENTLMAPFY